VLAKTNQKPNLIKSFSDKSSINYNALFSIEWLSPTDVFLTSKPQSSWECFTDALFCKNRAKPLLRGYSKLAKFNDGRADFKDLMLVVHGIGQKSDINLIKVRPDYLQQHKWAFRMFRTTPTSCARRSTRRPRACSGRRANR
jgi:hypothetical protein